MTPNDSQKEVSLLFKLILIFLFVILPAEIIVLPKIEHDMLKEAGRQELVTVQQICGAVLENNPELEQNFILGTSQANKTLARNRRKNFESIWL